MTDPAYTAQNLRDAMQAVVNAAHNAGHSREVIVDILLDIAVTIEGDACLEDHRSQTYAPEYVPTEEDRAVLLSGKESRQGHS